MDKNLNNKKSLQDQLNDIASVSILNNDVRWIVASAARQISSLQKEVAKLNEDKMCLLKAMIGQPIYWANPNWRMETHTITGVRFEESYWSDFFDSNEEVYQGTPQIVIEIDGDDKCRGGDYLAARIGIDLFFDKEEALQHSRYANSIQR